MCAEEGRDREGGGGAVRLSLFVKWLRPSLVMWQTYERGECGKLRLEGHGENWRRVLEDWRTGGSDWMDEDRLVESDEGWWWCFAVLTGRPQA